MAMGQQKDRQGDLMVGWAEMPRSPGHVFYDRLQSVLIEGGFDAFAEASCRPYYAARMGAPSVPPGRYFRMHLVGYFEGIDSERGLEWRCSDSLSLREFLRLGSRERVPDHSWLSKTRARLPVPSIYSIVPPNDGSALRHGHHFEPVDFVIDHGRGHHDAYSAGSCQRTYARACGCRQRSRCHREELIQSERGWSGREAFVTMMQTADLGQGNDRSGPGRLNGSSIRCVLAERQVGP